MTVQPPQDPGHRDPYAPPVEGSGAAGTPTPGAQVWGHSGYGQAGHGHSGYGQAGHGHSGYGHSGYGQGPGQSAYTGQQYMAGAWATPPPSLEGMAVASLVVGILGLLIFTVLSPIALGLGIAGIIRTRRNGTRGQGLAVAGTVLGGLGTLALAAFGGLILTMMTGLLGMGGV